MSVFSLLHQHYGRYLMNQERNVTHLNCYKRLSRVYNRVNDTIEIRKRNERDPLDTMQSCDV